MIINVKPFIDQWYNLPVISFHPTDKKLFRLLFKTYFEFIVALGILLFLLTIYKSEIIHSGLIRSHYYIFYIFAFTIILLTLLVQLFNEKIKTNINLMLTTSFLLLFTIEIPTECKTLMAIFIKTM